MQMQNDLYEFENYFWNKGYESIAGVDEVGRGPLAGPLVCAAVIIDKHNKISGLNDSKKLSPKKREFFFDVILQYSTAVAVSVIDESVIETLNIYHASKYGMMQAVSLLSVKPDFVLSDAMKFDDLKIPYKSIIKGDQKSASIAAASIIAKVIRDNIMFFYHKKYPQYDFIHNVGYPTKKHLLALKKYGIIPIHRKNYAPVKKIVENEKYYT